MRSNPPSSSEVVRRLKHFRPPYCPRPGCPWHDPKVAKEQGKFSHHDSRPTKKFPYLSIRFRCACCDKAFTSSFFSLSYRDKLPDTYEEIFHFWYGGKSKRETARTLKCSLDTVLQRFRKMARHGLLRMAKDKEGLKIKESVAYDGLENFSFSQYDPNNINHAVGRESLYLYDFNFCHLNRKGRVSEGQKKKLKRIEEEHGRYPARAIEHCSKRVFERLLSKADSGLLLHTDNHFLYRDAIRKIKDREKIFHSITPAKFTRNYQNKLFAINHMDMLTRHHLSDYKRETIAFAKTSQSMIESFVLFSATKNYMRPKFTKKQKRDPQSNTTSPAMHLKLESRILSFREFFKTRITKHQVKLSEDWLLYFERRDPHSRRPIRAYNGI